MEGTPNHTKTREQVCRPGVRSLETEQEALDQLSLPPEWVRRLTAQDATNFDPQRRAAKPGLKDAIKRVSRYLEQQEVALGLRQRRRSAQALRGFRLAIEALICNFGGLLAAGSPPILAVPRHSGAMWGHARYRPAVYGQHFLDALDLLAHPQIGVIEDVARGYGSAGGPRQRSIVRLKGRLFEHLHPSLFQATAIEREVDREVLVLRGCKDEKTGQAEPIDYPETDTTRRLRSEVQEINDHLRKAPIILLPDNRQARASDGQPIDPLRKTVWRIFNNGSWEQGGRLYNGFWETMKREDRFRLLRISTRSHPDGEPIANVDHGQLFPRLAYIEVGLPPAEDEDLYDIVGDGLHRDGWKQLVNALLLSERTLRNWPEGASASFPPGTKLRDTVAAIRKRHAPIAHLFGSGAGLRFMWQESRMLVETLLQLFRRGITALPLHDSVLCPVSAAPIAKATMQNVFANFTGGAKASIKITTS
jgi:hypothetical protein